MMYLPNGVRNSAVRGSANSSRSGVVWYSRGGAERTTAEFVAIARACPDLNFIVVGAEVELDSLMNVTELGWVPDVANVLTSTRCLLNTSVQEGSPNMALQAIAAGCRVVGGSNAGILELAHSYPDHVESCDLSDAVAVAKVLQRQHNSPRPPPASVPTLGETVSKWSQLIRGER